MSDFPPNLNDMINREMSQQMTQRAMLDSVPRKYEEAAERIRTEAIAVARLMPTLPTHDVTGAESVWPIAVSNIIVTGPFGSGSWGEGIRLGPDTYEKSGLGITTAGRILRFRDINETKPRQLVELVFVEEGYDSVLVPEGRLEFSPWTRAQPLADCWTRQLAKLAVSAQGGNAYEPHWSVAHSHEQNAGSLFL